MIPTNLEEQGCDPTSSNCVIWQGPDLDCIKLCKGDTITDVTYKLATELCSLLEQFEITNYDLSCLNLNVCQPEDFKALIQLLIQRICDLEGIDNTGTGTGIGCPDCTVNICEDFYYQSPQGDTLTTMQLTDYVLAIGNRVCTIINQITTINLTLLSHNERITDLENATAPVFTMPQITPTCVIDPAVPTDLDQVLIAVEQQFCELRLYVGDTQAILLAMQAACPSLNSSPQLGGSGTMQQLQGWFPTTNNMAQSLSNAWKTICDLRSAVEYLQNAAPTGCAAIQMIMTPTVTGANELTIYFTGTIPGSFIDSAGGSVIAIQNSSGGTIQTVNSVLLKSLYYDTAQPLIITLDAGINSALDINVDLTLNLTDNTLGTICNNSISEVALGTDSCPALVIIPSFLDVSFNFPWVGPTPTYISVELYDATGTALLQTTVVQVTNTTPSGAFSTLTDNTSYKMRIIINGVPCEFYDFTTLEYVCTAPTLNAETISYTNPTGDQTAQSIVAWVAEYESFFGPIYP
jgi:hypothetical protein